MEDTLAGDAGELKESVIGVKVFERDASYDPRIDPIVRVMAGRLRSRLDQYYAAEGRNDPVRIDFPKGSYVPQFRFAEIAAPSTETRTRAAFLRSRWSAAAVAVLLAAGAGSAVWFGRGTRPASAGRQSRSQEAYRLYSKAESYALTSTPDFLQYAVQYLNLALAADPDYALAHASLSLAYAKLAETETVPADEALLQAKAQAREALRLNDSLAEGHHALARAVLLADYDWERADREFRRAVTIDPAYIDARYAYAHLCLNPRGRHDEAARQLEEGLKKDPLSSNLNTELGSTDIKRGRIDQAIDRFRQNLARYPEAPGTLTNLAIALQAKSQYQEALSNLVRARRVLPHDPWVASHLAMCCIRLGQHAQAQTILEELTTRGGRAPTPEYAVAAIYAGLGDTSAAFEHLERAYSLRSVQLLWLNVDRRLEPLRSDPRFAGLLARIRLQGR